MKQNDWRRNIKDIDDLNDIDPLDMLIVLRHNFLECAKDLYCERDDVDFEIGQEALLLAENCQASIDMMCNNDMAWLEPAFTTVVTNDKDRSQCNE